MTTLTVTSQPGYGSRAPAPPPLAVPPIQNSVLGCPAGLEYLTQLDTLLVYQKIEILEAITGFDCKNQYSIMNAAEQQVYYAREQSSLLQRICCGPGRGFEFSITDNQNQEVLRIRREFKCCRGCPCWIGDGCWYYASISDRYGTLLGYVSNLNFCCYPALGLFDANRRLVARMDGPFCAIQAVCCQGDVDFPVIELDSKGQTIGKIAKLWPGFCQDAFTKADNFRVTFPIDLDPKKKALILGTVFVMDIVVFEPQKQNQGLKGAMN